MHFRLVSLLALQLKRAPFLTVAAQVELSHSLTDAEAQKAPIASTQLHHPTAAQPELLVLLLLLRLQRLHLHLLLLQHPSIDRMGTFPLGILLFLLLGLWEGSHHGSPLLLLLLPLQQLHRIALPSLPHLTAQVFLQARGLPPHDLCGGFLGQALPAEQRIANRRRHLIQLIGLHRLRLFWQIQRRRTTVAAAAARVQVMGWAPQPSAIGGCSASLSRQTSAPYALPLLGAGFLAWMRVRTQQVRRHLQEDIRWLLELARG